MFSAFFWRNHVFGDLCSTKSRFRWHVDENMISRRENMFSLMRSFRWRQRFRCRKHVFANLPKKSQVISPKTILDGFALVKFRLIFQKKIFTWFRLDSTVTVVDHFRWKCTKWAWCTLSQIFVFAFWKTIFYIATFCKKQSQWSCTSISVETSTLFFAAIFAPSSRRRHRPRPTFSATKTFADVFAKFRAAGGDDFVNEIAFGCREHLGPGLAHVFVNEIMISARAPFHRYGGLRFR